MCGCNTENKSTLFFQDKQIEYCYSELEQMYTNQIIRRHEKNSEENHVFSYFPCKDLEITFSVILSREQSGDIVEIHVLREYTNYSNTIFSKEDSMHSEWNLPADSVVTVTQDFYNILRVHCGDFSAWFNVYDMVTTDEYELMKKYIYPQRDFSTSTQVYLFEKSYADEVCTLCTSKEKKNELFSELKDISKRLPYVCEKGRLTIAGYESIYVVDGENVSKIVLFLNGIVYNGFIYYNNNSKINKILGLSPY